MSSRGVVIRFEELPARANSLGPGEVSQLFGGCGQVNAACASDQDCCNLTLNIPGAGIYYHLRWMTSYNPPLGFCGGL
jgi:hypothetical protein